MNDGEQIWDDVPPRPLSAAQLALVAHLAGALPPAALLQVATCAVTGHCRCGCPSVRLTCDGPPVAASEVAAFSPYGEGGAVEVRACAPEVEVTLRLLDGVLYELEVFAGEGVVPALPKVADLGPAGPFVSSGASQSI